MTKVFTHALTVIACALIALVWLTPFVQRVLDVLWPIMALSLSVFVACSALALSIRVMGMGLNTLRPTPPAIEVFQPEPPTTFARQVIDAFVRDDELSHLERWNNATQQFCMIGDSVGFSVIKMQPYISRKKRQVYVDLLTANPPTRPVLADYGQGTQWSREWTLRGLRLALKHRALALPYPNDDPPAVLMVPPGETRTAHTAYTPNTVSIATTPGGVTHFSPMS